MIIIKRNGNECNPAWIEYELLLYCFHIWTAAAKCKSRFWKIINNEMQFVARIRYTSEVATGAVWMNFKMVLDIMMYYRPRLYIWLFFTTLWLLARDTANSLRFNKTRAFLTSRQLTFVYFHWQLTSVIIHQRLLLFCHLIKLFAW